jgi:hypothetical protein
MNTSRPTVRLRRGSLAANAVAATVAVIAASQLPGPVAEPQQPAPQAQGDQAQLFFSPWTEFCLKGQEPNAKEICFGGKDGRVEGVRPYDSPPTDPKVFAEQQQRLQQELARRAEEARKRLNQFLDESNR